MNRILVVDGQEWVTDLISRLLTTSGYEVMTSESGNNALAKLEMFRPDLVLLDLELPDMSGYDVCKRIKQNPDTQYIMVLCTTSLETGEMSMRVAQMGADDYAEKNIDPALLLLKIKSLLRVKNLSDQLKQKFAELEEKNNILEFQMRMGQQVQRSLMPNLDIQFNDMRISSRYMPAMDIGGDFYNLVKVDNECVGVLIGDVSGHGISAALLTAMFNSMVINHAKAYLSPDLLLYQINSEYCRVFESSQNIAYASIFYAVVDTVKRRIYYSNAGGALPLLVRYSTGMVIELDASGMPIGMDDAPVYEYKSVQYSSGDVLFLHTDGLSDTFFKDQPEEFTKRVNEILLSAEGSSPDEIAEAMLAEFYNLNPSPSEKYMLDDVTIIVCGL